ncbi:MAG: hypothetical protein A2487_19235 [Candidatus Raymondbacteria bacterium RifOxyC12_full_50_8]|uniref:Mannosylglycerate hydrolase MGH1-like glycoside hydrolase domain-containing protein n=1 Tax=Candidatus Raymondbacteria bacterium RIFOXYD12_FULL_49_13 TaxID=1817890 RepID=A0A1F7FFI2_UNCRA|nr:MAG: hypothetical protein A2248_22540 [Candidatus Raymondbacteria bacterium RIFOXYA2_FULL_49_16]OGK01031.1 MAG: hypothetical protein A2350_11695 [Candidatus Raymondbacteria bacterium RifOxyB12_full_50_8]OGK03381.1 MAG: hypothetical protein A2487_19235 [Candidatus Raymondbacteria bacterium RifOxyC12_full_50_8]OGK05351.1 MAG: hypothetical protein A2519_03490 [Candidatus Raymondbacteria bacterium RIFOXYD12_FULL_49_13]OGP42964.1 MAG: hypothetical protein A2324_16195 [Candidatus Raymondbacteria b
MRFDLRAIPFSRQGSFFAVSRLPAKDKRPAGLYLRSVRGDITTPDGEIFRIDLVRNKKPVKNIRECAAPHLLTLSASVGLASICFDGIAGVRVAAKGVGLRLTLVPGAYGTAIPVNNQVWAINNYANKSSYFLRVVSGTAAARIVPAIGHTSDFTVSLHPAEEGEACECVIEEQCAGIGELPAQATSFIKACAATQRSWNSWLFRTLQTTTELDDARTLGAYINWSAHVGPSGHLTRPVLYMSKNWMNSIWSWDNCFNALAHVRSHPHLAWDQLMIFADHQNKNGAYPDSINDKQIGWNFCKPPVHGWALSWMMQRSAYCTPERLARIYPSLVAWTNRWFLYRDYDGDGIPQYNHGNDSGWDNATVFDNGVPVEAPDHPAYLVLQMDTLSEIAGKLGKKGEARKWTNRANLLLKKFIVHSWKNNSFMSFKSGDHTCVKSDSLINYMPIVLGKRLPIYIKKALLKGLRQKGRFLTDNGFATESVKSKHYETDGYWRGPIWAPSTMLLVDGLYRAGERGFSEEIAGRFCAMAAKNGMAECFDAVSGKGLRDLSYTWTASVFLVLANEYTGRVKP